METFVVPGQGLVLDGATVNTPTAARRAAGEWLKARGVDEWTVEEATAQAPVARAWWGSEEVGFVQKHHELATVVAVVQLPEYLLHDEQPDERQQPELEAAPARPTPVQLAPG